MEGIFGGMGTVVREGKYLKAHPPIEAIEGGNSIVVKDAHCKKAYLPMKLIMSLYVYQTALYCLAISLINSTLDIFSDS